MNHNAVRVFIVEDSPLLRERIAGDIVALGHFNVVGWAESENEAVESIEKFAPEVVVTDIQLKQGSGIAVMQQIRSRCPGPPPTIVVLSNYGLAYKAQCLEYGADDFFDKSSEYDQFLKRMRCFTVH